MQEGKAYQSNFNGNPYEVRISPAEINGAKGFSASIYTDRRYIGALKGVASSVDDALKQSALIIKAFDKYSDTASNIDGDVVTMNENEKLKAESAEKDKKITSTKKSATNKGFVLGGLLGITIGIIATVIVVRNPFNWKFISKFNFS